MSLVVQRGTSTLQMRPKSPLIAVVGATGTGKSQLAVSLAQRFDGEIINGDALQMYEGLPITTNKITLEGRKGVPHHLIGCIKLREEPWTVKQFMNRARKIIEEIRSRQKLPILVGGTHYYTQSLLFKDAVIKEKSDFLTEVEREQRWPILRAETSDILEELIRVDPAIAKQWHPNDRRKIRRSLEIYLTTGRKASDIYHEQRRSQVEKENHGFGEDIVEKDQRSGTKAESSLYDDTLIFWTHAAADTLGTRLERRVDGMIVDGLLDEVASMHAFLQDQKRQGNSPDQSKGIWIAIGFKELVPCIITKDCSDDLRQESIDRAKITTKQYAKRQVRWIRLKLQRAVTAAASCHTMFLLDGSDLSQWSRLVEAKALAVTARFLNGTALPPPASLSLAAMHNLITTEKATQCARFCEACDKTLMSEEQWFSHLDSKGHKSAVRPKVDWGKLYPKDKRT